MKKYCLFILIALSVAFLLAELGPVNSMGDSFFAGKLGCYAKSDTLAYVLAQRSENNNLYYHLLFQISYDGGQTWQSSIVDSSSFHYTEPTLFYSPEEIIVSWNNREEHISQYAQSFDSGNSWSISQNWNTFESSPYIEKYNGLLRQFALKVPYPQWDQAQYLQPEESDHFKPVHLYFKDSLSPNQTNTYFFGYEDVQGVVRCNSDINIKQVGGGTNNSWPTFHEPVIISGNVNSSPPAFPLDSVFQGGLIENAPPLEFSNFFFTRYNYLWVGPTNYDPNRILLVDVQGDSCIAYVGQITLPHRTFTDVWTNYPVNIEEPPLFTNHFTICDTIWLQIPTIGHCNNRGFFVNSKLWIKGTFSGHQVWCAADTIMIIGEILLSGTVPGESPENNLNDSVKLISEKSVLLKYGYVDPVTRERIHPNCFTDDNPGNYYADIYALQENPNHPYRKDGIFSFEYQHPHPSMPDLFIGDSLYTWIDLHRYHYPQTSANPWLSQLDLPWYNPLWPEAQPYLERGKIQLWGSVNQICRGFIHRALYDLEYPSNYGIWNPDIDYCGGSSYVSYTDSPTGIYLRTQNYPGALGGGIGYKKIQHADNRFSWGFEDPNHPIFYPWKLGISVGDWGTTENLTGFTEVDYVPQYRPIHSKCFVRKGDKAYFAANDVLAARTGDLPSIENLTLLTKDQGNISGLHILVDNALLVHQEKETNSSRELEINVFTGENYVVTNSLSLPVFSAMNDVAVLENGNILLATLESNRTINLRKLNNDGTLTPLETWQLDFLDPQIQIHPKSKLCLQPRQQNTLEVTFMLFTEGENAEPDYYQLYRGVASIPVAINDPYLSAMEPILFYAYPNPMHSNLFLQVKVPRSNKHKIEIYNLKGQKVTTLRGNSAKNEVVEYNWNGCDTKGKNVAAGIYFARLCIDGKVLQTKRICKY